MTATQWQKLSWIVISLNEQIRYLTNQQNK
jgi:hypothetical protein